MYTNKEQRILTKIAVNSLTKAEAIQNLKLFQKT